METVKSIDAGIPHEKVVLVADDRAGAAEADPRGRLLGVEAEVFHQVERNAGAGAPETGAAVHGHHACVRGARGGVRAELGEVEGGERGGPGRAGPGREERARQGK